MKQYDCGPQQNAFTDCETSHAKPTVQPFPEIGLLYDNSNLQLDCLTERIGEIRGKTYSYVVRTVKLKKLDSSTVGFEQHGSAPNFQGDLLTLCTCKHQMRSRLSAEQWQENVWIAGFTSRTIHRGKHWLFYLAKVKSANDSQSHLWSSMTPESRNAKAAHLHFLGDIFKPKTPQPTGSAQFLPSQYVTPKDHAHKTEREPNGWHRDIKYRHPLTSNRAPLLVADPALTFLWDKPMICFVPQKHCRDYHRWRSLRDLMAKLRAAR